MKDGHFENLSWHVEIKEHFEKFREPGRSIVDFLMIIEAERHDVSENMSWPIYENYKKLHITGKEQFIENVLEEIKNSEHWDSGLSDTYQLDEARRLQYARALAEILDRFSELKNCEGQVYKNLFFEARDNLIYQHEWSRHNFALICSLPSWTLDEATATLMGVRHDRVTKNLIDVLPDTSPLRQGYDHLYELLLRSYNEINANTQHYLSPPKLITWARHKGIRLPDGLSEALSKYFSDKIFLDDKPTYEQIVRENELLKLRSKDAHKSRSNILYKLVIGLLAKHYKNSAKFKGDEFDPHAYRISKISGVIAESGLTVSDDTIRSVIQDAKNYVDRADQRPDS